MPAALPLVAGAFLAAGSIATAVGLTTAFVVAGLAISWAAVLTITGVALLAVAYLARKTPKPDSGGQQLKQKLDPQAPVPVLYGRSATGGFITWRGTWGAKNAMYGIVTVLSAGGPIAGIEAYKAGDYPIGFGGSPAYSLATVNNVGGYSGSSKLYKGKLAQRWQNGAAPANTTPGGASGLPIPAGAMSGLAHVITRYEFSNDAFPQGLPSSLWTASGVKLYDPRKDSTYPGGSGAHRVDQPATWTYSENPFLAALQWTLGRYENGHRVYGIGAKWAEVDVASFVTGANVADANGWKVGGVVTTDDDKYAVLASLLAAGGGVPVARGAQIACTVNAPKTSVLTLTKEDIVGEVETSSTTSWRDRQNTIIPKYREETQGWEIIAGEQISSPVYIEEDGGEQKTVEVEFPLVQQAAQAHQLATYELCNSREFLTFTVNAKLRLLAVRVGDAITVNVPQIAAKNIKCTITGREFNPSDMSVTLSLKSETDAKHAFALGQSQVAPPAPKLDGYDPSNPGAPAANAWAITATQISKDETTLPIIVVTGATDDPNTSTVIVEYRPTGSDTWLNYGEFPRTSTRIEVSGLTDQTAYDVALSYRTVRGVVGERLVLNATAGAFTVSWTDTVTGANKPADNATVGAPVGTEVGGRPVTQLIGDVDNAKGNAQTAVDALKNNAGVIVPVRDLLASERADTNAAVADAKKAGTDAQAAVAQTRTDLTAAAADAKKAGTDAQAQAAQVRTDLNASVNTARGEAAQAQADANTARTDLASEVSRAKGEEGAIRSTVASVKQTADGAAASISDEITVRANADSALSNRARDLEATVFNGPNQNTTLSSRITDEETVRANADSAIASRATKLEAGYSNLSKVVPNDHFDNGLEGWLGFDVRNIVVPSSAGRSNVLRTPAGMAVNGIVGRKVSISTPDQRFKLKVSWRCVAAGAVYYFGAVYYDENNNHVAASDGTGNYPLGPNVYVNSATNSGWIDREVIIGKGVTEGSPYGGTRVIPAGAVYFRPIVFLNYLGEANSVTELDYFVVEEVTDIVATKALVTDEATARANADSALGNRVSTTEAKLEGSQDSTLAARIRDEATARVNSDSAITSRTNVLEAGAAAATNSLNPNSTFSIWPDGQALPTGMTWWNRGSSTVSRSSSTLGRGGYSALFNSVAGEESGLGWDNIYNTPGWHVLEADVWKQSGVWEGSGVTLGGVYSLDFLRDPDTNGQVGEITYGGVRRFTKLINFTDSVYRTFHPMNHWNGFSTNRTAKSMLWLRAIVRPATAGEILAQKANSTADNAQARITDEATASANRDSALATRANALETSVNTGPNNLVSLAGRISDEATSRAQNDGVLSGRISNTEAKLNGDQDSWVAARIRDEATASANRDSALTNRTTTLESKAGSLQDEVNKRFPGFEVKGANWGWDTQNGGRIGGDVVWEGYHPKGAGIAFRPGMGSWLYMDPFGWIKTTPGKRYRAGFWVWQYSAPGGYGGSGRVYWEGQNENHTVGSYLGATLSAPEATVPFYQPVPNGAWHCYASDLQVDDAITANADSYWIRPRINIDYIPANAGYVIAGWFFREVTGEFDNAAKITEEATTRTNADSALATRATNLETSVNNGATGNLALQGKISDEATTRSNTDSALATRATALEASATNAGNLVPNSAFVTSDGWFLNSPGNGAILERNRAGPGYQIGGIENNLCLYQAAGGSGLQAEALSEKFAVKAGEYYQVQALTSAHRARAWVSLFYYDAANNFVGYAGENFGERINAGGQSIHAQDITGAKSSRAPDSAIAARVAFRIYDITNDGYAWFSRPYAGVVKSNTDQWNSYTPGNDRTVLVQTNAKISEEATARANADSAMVTRANNLEATVFNGPNQNSSLSSRITDEVTARTNAYDALAGRSNTLESKIEGNVGSGLQTLIKNNRKNLIDVGWWKQGASIPWPLNGGQRNEIVNFPHGPNFNSIPLADGSSGDAWLCQADNSGTNAGGWSGGPMAPLDPDKTYRFVVPIAQLGGDVGRVSYWGTNNVCDLNTTNENGNPYFAIHSNMTLNRWHLFVGYLFPRNSTGKTHDGAGVYDMVTGEKVAAGWNYCFRPDGAQPLHRAYQFYSVNGAYQAFGRPMVEVVDGTETPFAPTLTAKAGVTAATARIANEETTRANADSALASRATKIEASYNMSGGSLVPNDKFANWVDGATYPRGWVTWSAEGNYRVSRVDGRSGSPYAVQTLNDAGEVESGFYVPFMPLPDGKYIVTATVRLDANVIDGAGVTLHGQYSIDFVGDPDINGVTRGSVVGETRTWTKTFDIAGFGGGINVHAMTDWIGFGRYRAPKYLTWYELSIRPASAAERLAYSNAARITAEETTRANADSALASRTTVVEAQVSNDSANLVRNGTFNAPGWVGRGAVGIPPYWNGWSNDNGGFLGASPRDSRYGAPAPFQCDRQGINNGISQPVYNLAPGWYAFEVDITGEDGNWSGSGVHVNFNNGYAFNFDFAASADTAGRVGDIGTANRQFTWLFYNGANTGQANLYLMSGWAGFRGGTNFGFFRGVWHRIVMRPATAGEIEARKVTDSNIIARVTSAEGAIATVDGKTQAYFEKKASVPGADAFISAVAKNDNGVATSNVAIGGTSIALYNTENGAAKRAMFLAGGNAVFDGSITATTGIIVGTGKLKVQIAATDYAVVHDQYVSFGYDLGRAPSVTFGPCPVGLNTGEVYAPYAAELSSTGFRAKLLINAAPQSTAQSTGAFANQGGNIYQVSKGGRPNAANGQYTFVVNLSANGYAYSDNGDYR